MKQVKFLSVFVFIIMIMVSCNKTPHDKIAGKWDVEKIENSAMTEAGDIEFLNEMNAEVLKTEVFEFDADKISKKLPETIEGNWEMDEIGTTLTIDWGIDDMYSPHTYKIYSLTNDSLVIEEDFDEFFIKTSFVKVK